MEQTLKAERCICMSTRFMEFPLVRSLLKEFGSKGFLLAVAILSEVASSGTEARYGRKFRDRITAVCPDVSHNLIKMVVRRMTDAGFFNRVAFVTRRVLTPPSGYVVSCMEDILHGTVSQAPYFLLSDFSPVVSSEETAVISEKTRVIPEETDGLDCFNLKDAHYGTTEEAGS